MDRRLVHVACFGMLSCPGCSTLQIDDPKAVGTGMSALLYFGKGSTINTAKIDVCLERQVLHTALESIEVV